MPDLKPIAIIGAGIAGLSAALALARLGLPVTLIEKKPRLAEEGAGIQLSPNATHCLLSWGLGAALARRAVAPERLDLRRLSEPRAYLRARLTPLAEAFGAPFWTILRADLHGILLDAVRSLGNVRLLVGRHVAGLSMRPDGVLLRIESESGGAERLEAVAALGADGLHSRFRGQMGETGPPIFRGYEAWRALLPASAAPGFMSEPAIALAMGKGCHLVHYPVSAGAAVNIVFICPAREPREGWSAEGNPAELASKLTGIARAMADPLAQIRDWKIWSLYDLHAPPFAKGRLGLIGDAAHPVLPFLAQGAAMAIEDAAVLAAAFAATPDDPARAIESYWKARRMRVRRVQWESRRNARRYHLSPALARLRDAYLAFRGPDYLTRRLDWLYGWRPDA